MTVYILFGLDYQNTNVLGVFNSRAACSKIMAQQEYDEYEIQEWDVETE